MNRALAYWESLRILRQMHISSYSFPKYISVPKYWHNPNEQAVTIVRENYGVVGLKNAWSRHEIRNGATNWRVAIVTKEETELLNKNNHKKFYVLPSWS